MHWLRRPLAIEGGDRGIESLSDLDRGLGRDADDPLLDPVDLEVGDTELVGEILPAHPSRLADFPDPACDDRLRFGSGHVPDLSNLDRQRKALSVHERQGGDTVCLVARTVLDLTYEECSRWLLDLGFKRDDGEPDWDRLLKRAKVGTHKDTVKNRWKRWGAPKDRAKIRTTLELLEDEKGGTPYGAAVRKFEEWLDLGRALALKRTAAFEGQLVELREVISAVDLVQSRAEAETKILQLEELALRSITPVPKQDRSPTKTGKRDGDDHRDRSSRRM